jgi:bacteriocin-like protein
MSEDPKKPSEDEKKKETSDELSNKDLEQVTGGMGYEDIKGDVTSARHEKWIDVNS